MSLDHTIELLLLRAAHRDVDLYRPTAPIPPRIPTGSTPAPAPAPVPPEVAGIGSASEEYQKGWNDAVHALSMKATLVGVWHQSLPVYVADAVTYLLDKNVITLRCNVERNMVSIWVIVEDVFPDQIGVSFEPVLQHVVKRLSTLHRNFGNAGIVAWLSFVRGIEPIAAYRTSEYIKAKDVLN